MARGEIFGLRRAGLYMPTHLILRIDPKEPNNACPIRINIL